MSDSILLPWAKLGNATWPEQYHPVLCHLIDVGQVARSLWDENVVRPKTRKWLTDRLGLAEEFAVGAWLAFWAAAHDIGKMAPCFQSQGKTDQLIARLKGDRFDFPAGSRPHGDISTKVLANELESIGRGWPAVPKKV